MPNPVGQRTDNCHYITRFLTTPWETVSSRGDGRHLRYFDFDRDAFDEESSRTLFSADRLNEPPLETWLNTMIETPLGHCRRRVERGDANALDNWRDYRAATLMLWLQGARASSLHELDACDHLHELAQRSTEQIDALVCAFREQYDLCAIHVGSAFPPLFVPSTGCFPIFYRDEGCLSGYAVGFALPIAPRCVLAALAVEQHGVRHTDALPELLPRLSIGTSAVRQVVVFPEFLDRVGEVEVRQGLLDLRRRNDEVVQLATEARELVLQAFATAGLSPRLDHAKRIVPPGPVNASWSSL